MSMTSYNLYQENDFNIEKPVLKDYVKYVHLTLPKGNGLPKHMCDGEVFMTVLRGRLSITLNEEDTQEFDQHTMLHLNPKNMMHVRNEHDQILELIIVKLT